MSEKRFWSRARNSEPSWPIDGTTGYDFLNQAGGLFVDSENEEAINRDLSRIHGRKSTDYAAVCRDKKHQVLRDLLGSDVNRLTSLLSEICEKHRERRDYTRNDAIRAIREVVACFPVYRTYVVPEREEITAEDERYVKRSDRNCEEHRPEMDPELFDFVRDVLLLKVRGAA